MKFTASDKFCWYNNGRIIVKMYFLNDIPFTFDELPDGHLYDRDLIAIANTNPEYEIEDVYKGSNYLIMEQCHPCFDVIEILNSEILPDDLIYSVDEEDFHG
jgi:hypothetical protein